jgi:zona occludens toxin (predicted ATPase)
MALTLITGVPGTGKTAFLVSELEKIAATGRKIFVDNINSLKVPHYRAGKVSQWQAGTWLHIDQYIRTSPAIVAATKEDIEEDDSDGNQNWAPNPEIIKDDDGNLSRIAFDAQGKAVGAVPYENHQGALLVIDECQRHFRPRPAGSNVPDFVAALEVHRHQGLDIWLVSQRPGLVDANVRAICDKHIALRKTPFGRYKYEWSEVGDIESKSSRDTASKSRFNLPKHAFSLYKSAEVHNVTKHSMPFVGKLLILIIPFFIALAWYSYSIINKKFKPDAPKESHVSEPLTFQDQKNSNSQPKISQQAFDALPNSGLERYVPPLNPPHPYQGSTFSIVARMQSGSKDYFRFMVSSPQKGVTSLSDKQLQASGYSLSERSDCSVKLTYKDFSTFATCGELPAGRNEQPTLASLSPSPTPLIASSSDAVTENRNYQSIVLADRSSGPRNSQ